MTDDDLHARFAEITSGEELSELRGIEPPRTPWGARWWRFANSPWTAGVVAVLFLLGCAIASYTLH